MKRQPTGLTLAELLIAAVLVGVLSVGLSIFTVASLNMAARAKQTADALVELRVVNSYIADNLRQANYVYPDSSSITLPSSLTCQVSATLITNPCLAFTRPVANSAGTITGCVFIAYRFANRSLLGSDFKTADTWADNNTSFLAEYRLDYALDGSGTCNTRPASLSSAVAQVVLDYVDKGYGTRVSPANGYNQPFTLSPSVGTVTRVTIKLSQTRQVGPTQVYVPLNATAQSSHPSAVYTTICSASACEAGFVQSTVALRNAS